MKETETASSTNEGGAEAAPAVLTGVTPSGSSGYGTVTESVNPAEGEQVGVGSSFGKSDKERSAAMTPQPDIFSGIPQLGAYRTADHRYYWNGKGPLPSVTTILGVLDKPAIVQWAKRTVAEMAVNRWEELGALIQKEGTEAAIKWLASLPDYQKDTAARLGSGVHLLADMASRSAEPDSETFQVSEQEKPYLEAFLRFLSWLREQGGEIVSSEKMVWSVNGYAGTYDLIIRLRDELWLLDVKTSKGYYPEYALQLVAYGYADQIIEDNPTGWPMPVIQKYGVLHLRPELYPDYGYRLVQYPVIDTDYVAFLGALEVYRWKEEKRYTKTILSKHYVT